MARRSRRSVFAQCVILTVFLADGNGARLSFKDSLTAYADRSNFLEAKQNPDKGKVAADPLPISDFPHAPSPRKCTFACGSSAEHRVQHDKLPSGNNNAATFSSLSASKSFSQKLVGTSFTRPGEPGQHSLWEITRDMLQKFGKEGQSRADFSNASLNGKLIQTRVESPSKAWENMVMTMKNELGGLVRKSSRNGTTTRIPNSLGEPDEAVTSEAQRSKKEVIGARAGLRDLAWNTVKALWSVNKEHFLPTFLHTKTGGKLSLIRDSLFKPVTILSQFRNGVQQINDEKWKNLARLSNTAGHGWSSPASHQVFLVKVQPENSKLLTLANYAFRLTKHTVVTKWKLKRALLDLQLRAVKKLLRILQNKSLHQKLATIKILTNAVWRGKLGFWRALTGGRNKTYGPYGGKDNSAHVDITYKAPGNNYHVDNHYHGTPPPPLPPAPEYYAPPPPPSDYNSYAAYNPYKSPSAHLSTSYEPPSPPPLIETPSYASLLKTMGINPSSYALDIFRSKSTPAPSILYYSSSKSTEKPAYHAPPPVRQPVIEKPIASYSYPFFSSSGKDTEAGYSRNREISVKPPTSFGLKLLEAMSAAPSS